MADEAVILDNSGLQPERVLMLRNGQVVWRTEILPRCVEQVMLSLHVTGLQLHRLAMWLGSYLISPSDVNPSTQRKLW